MKVITQFLRNLENNYGVPNKNIPTSKHLKTDIMRNHYGLISEFQLVMVERKNHIKGFGGKASYLKWKVAQHRILVYRNLAHMISQRTIMNLEGFLFGCVTLLGNYFPFCDTNTLVVKQHHHIKRPLVPMSCGLYLSRFLVTAPKWPCLMISHSKEIENKSERPPMCDIQNIESSAIIQRPDKMVDMLLMALWFIHL